MKRLKKAAAALGLAVSGVERGMRSKEREAKVPIEARELGGYAEAEREHASELDRMAAAFLANPDRSRAAVMGTSQAADCRRELRELAKAGASLERLEHLAAQAGLDNSTKEAKRAWCWAQEHGSPAK